MRLRNKLTRRVNCVGAAFVVALFFIVPFTANAAVVNILPPVSTWSVGYYQSNGVYNPSDPDNRGLKTSPVVSVITGRTYHIQLSNINFDNQATTINEFDENQNFIRRVQNNQIQFDYVPSGRTTYVAITERTYGENIGCIMEYDTEDMSLPNGSESVYDDVHFGGDGDFYTIGNEKALIYFKYLPNADLKYIRVEAVNNYGKRLKFRVVGYVHGSEVFRSGLADFGENIDIQSANFDYYNIYLVNLDDDNQSIPVEYIQSFRYIYGIKYYIYPPTDPPGISEEIYPTDYIDLNVNDWYIPTAPAADNTIDNALKMFNLIESRLFSLFPFYTLAGAVAFAIWLVWHYNRED